MAEVEMTEQEYEDELGKSYRGGISVGLRQASVHIMKMAMESFRDKGQNANMLRDIADGLEKMAEAAKKKEI